MPQILNGLGHEAESFCRVCITASNAESRPRISNTVCALSYDAIHRNGTAESDLGGWRALDPSTAWFFWYADVYTWAAAQRICRGPRNSPGFLALLTSRFGFLLESGVPVRNLGAGKHTSSSDRLGPGGFAIPARAKKESIGKSRTHNRHHYSYRAIPVKHDKGTLYHSLCSCLDIFQNVQWIPSAGTRGPARDDDGLVRSFQALAHLFGVAGSTFCRLNLLRHRNHDHLRCLRSCFRSVTDILIHFQVRACVHPHTSRIDLEIAHSLAYRARCFETSREWSNSRNSADHAESDLHDFITSSCQKFTELVK